MTATVQKKLLCNVINSLPPDELGDVFRKFSSLIEDYLDTHLTGEELEEHLQAIQDVRDGGFVLLSDLAD